jgi:Domain of unknown function (DUF4169)
MNQPINQTPRMADILNFNKARKRQQKAAREQQAAENRIRFGRTKAEKQLDAARAEADTRKLDGLKLEPAPLPHPKSPHEPQN